MEAWGEESRYNVRKNEGEWEGVEGRVRGERITGKGERERKS